MADLDPEKLEKANRYARIKRLLWLVDVLFSAVYFLAWIIFGWSKDVSTWIKASIANEWLLIGCFAAVFGGMYYLLDLPLDFYGGYTLPHRFGQSTQTLKGWVADQLKGLLIGIPLGLVILELVYLALRMTGGLWWLWTGIGMLFFSVILANLYPVLIMPLFNKFIPLGEEHAELAGRLVKLAGNARTRVRGVFKYDMSRRTKAASAFLAGIGSTRRIVLSDTLISEFTPDEIETVLAHELGHQVHNDIPLLIAFSTVLTIGGLYLASLGMQWAARYFGLAGAADIAGLPALGLLLGAFELITQPLNNAVVRSRERMADQYALQATGKNTAFASAFARLANQNLSEVDPEAWVIFMFYDHPPLKQRMEMARNWKQA